MAGIVAIENGHLDTLPETKCPKIHVSENNWPPEVATQEMAKN
jgi:hypothetical protein